MGTLRARTTAFNSADSLTILSRERSLRNTMMHPPQRRKSRDLLFLRSLQGPRPCLATSGSPASSSMAQARIVRLLPLGDTEVRFLSKPRQAYTTRSDNSSQGGWQEAYTTYVGLVKATRCLSGMWGPGPCPSCQTPIILEKTPSWLWLVCTT